MTKIFSLAESLETGATALESGGAEQATVVAECVAVMRKAAKRLDQLEDIASDVQAAAGDLEDLGSTLRKLQDWNGTNL